MSTLRSMTIIEKTDLIKALGTAQLIKDIHAAEEELQKLQDEELQFRSKSGEYLPGKSSSDCDAIKLIEAELVIQAPVDPDSKKAMTVDARKAWIERQRTENKDLAEAVKKQRMAEFTSGDFAIKIESARTKLTDLRAILGLRTAQITFLAGDVRTTLALEDELEQSK